MPTEMILLLAMPAGGKFMPRCRVQAKTPIAEAGEGRQFFAASVTLLGIFRGFSVGISWPRLCWGDGRTMPNTDPIIDLYRRHAPAVFRRARQLLGIEADAHEVVQEVFLSLVERPEQFDGRSAMTTFLYAVTTHACLNRVRNRDNRSRLERQQWPTPELDERDRRLSPEQRLMLHRALERMPGDMADASIYYFVDGLTHHEISQLLGCSRRHVGDLLERISQWGSEEPSR